MIYSLAVGTLIGYFTFHAGSRRIGLKIMAGTKTSPTCIHLHHWMILSLILSVILLTMIGCKTLFSASDFVWSMIGFMLGGILEGLSRSDWNVYKTSCCPVTKTANVLS